MDPLSIEVVGGIVAAVVAGVGGAAYQLHRRRFRPFIQVVAINGTVLSLTEDVEFSADLLRELDVAAYLDPPQKPFSLGDVDAALEGIDTIQRRGSTLFADVQSSIAELEQATDERSALKALIPACAHAFLDEFIGRALLRGILTFDTPPTGLAEKFRVYEHDDDGGHFQLLLPGRALTLAPGLHRVPALKDRLLPFVDAMRYAQTDLLKSGLTRIARLLQDVLRRAEALKPRLEKLREEHARWAFELYMANYGETAMLIPPTGILQVRSRRWEKPLEERCHLVVYGSKDGKEYNRRQRNALVVGPGDGVSFVWITTRLQREMSRGNELRGRFADGASHARVKFDCISAGIRSRHTISTPWIRFSDGAV